MVFLVFHGMPNLSAQLFLFMYAMNFSSREHSIGLLCRVVDVCVHVTSMFRKLTVIECSGFRMSLIYAKHCVLGLSYVCKTDIANVVEKIILLFVY